MIDISQLAGQQFDEYRLEYLIGQGGMSAVYRAYQDELNRYVALKVLSSQLAQDASYKQRFVQEARMAASLEHPHIVPVYDFGTTEQMSYVVMRLLTNGTLKDRLGQPMRPGDVIVIVENIARALDYAHSRSIVHRDVKPGNIMFDEQGTVYLVDFGIAKAMESDLNLTANNVALGTPAYMAPEQWRDEQLTGKADQYALAVVAFQMLTGRQPFEAPTPHQLMYKHLNDEAPQANLLNPNLSPAVADVLANALSKDLSRRYPLVNNFANALKQAILSPQAPPPQPQQMPAAQQAPAPSPQPQQSYSPPPARPAPPSQPKQQTEAIGTQTIMMRIASGGLIGIVVLAVIALVVIGGILYFLFPSDDTPEPTNVSDSQSSVTQIVESNEASPTDISLTPLVPADEIISEVGRVQFIRTMHNQPEIPVRDAVFSPDGQMIASAHGDNLARIWHDLGGTPTVLSGHTDVVSALKFSPDSRVLATAGRDNTVRLWDVASGQNVSVLSGHSSAVRDVTFSPDGSLIASASEDGTVRLWNTGTGETVRTLTANEGRVLTVAFSADGSQLASAGWDSSVIIWDVQSGARRQTLNGHTEEVRSVAFSPDATRLASSSTDNTIRLWDLSNSTTIATLDEHGRDVWVVEFNPDGSILASGGRDNNLRVWDVASGQQIANLTGHVGWVLGVDFNADGSQIVSGSGDGSVHLWQVEE